MSREFPSIEKKFTQYNRGDILGDLWNSFNIDLQGNPGAMRVSPRLRLNVSTADLTNLGCPVAFKYFDGKIWSIGDTRVFSNNGQPNNAFVEDASGSAQTDYTADESDMEIFNGALYGTTTDALVKKTSAAGAWAVNATALSTGSPHLLAPFKKFNRLYITNLNSRIRSIDTADTMATSGDYTLNLLEDTYFITAMRATSTLIWVGTTDVVNQGGRGRVLTWDGISAQPTQEYRIEAAGVMAMITDDNDMPYIMDSNGVLSEFSGSGFREIGRLPFPDGKSPYNPFDTDNERFIHPNGLALTKNKTILAFIRNVNSDGSFNENCPAGVWEFIREPGAEKGTFVHRGSVSYNSASGSTITDYGQQQIARAGAIAMMLLPHSTPTGDSGTFLCGATYYTNSSSTTNGIFLDDSNDLIQKKGNFVTTWMDAINIEDDWKRLWAIYRRLLDSGDKIVLKYRLFAEDPVYADITWVDTTHFTTTTNVSAYLNYEVEILRGTGSGSTAHITNVADGGGGTYTVTIDEANTGVTTGTAKARFQKWIKLLPEITGQLKSYTQLPVGAVNTRIQVRGCFTFTGRGEFYKFKIISDDNVEMTG